MSELTEDDAAALRERLGDLDRERKRKRGAGRSPGRSVGRALGGVAAIGALGLAGYYLTTLERERADEPLGTSETADFQDEGEGFGSLTIQAAETPAAAPAAEPEAEPPPVETGPSATELALLETLDGLREELAAARAAPEAEPAAFDAGGDRFDALEQQLGALQAETAGLLDRAADADLAAEQAAAEIDRLETELAIARMGGGASVVPVATAPATPTPGAAVVVEEDSTGERIVAMGEEEDTGDAERLAELERRRQEEADFLDARIRSPIVAVGGSAEGAAREGEASGEGSGDFLSAGAVATEVEQATVIANPSRTVIQGTVIQAAMETAIDSSLPGAIRAVVSEDVHSYDGSRVLIPRGSKLIGRYDARIDATQRRLLVAWDRIITPDNQSVTLAAYGADELGRSGTTGVLDRRLGTRFGSAALVSLISALPGAASATVDDPVASGLAGELGAGAEDAAGSVLDEYLSVAPTIYVDQGARITVIVDRDLELY